MTKTKRSKKTFPSLLETSDSFSENCKVVYESFLKRGFSSEQSFKLLLVVIEMGS
jgi:hypothetical protein